MTPLYELACELASVNLLELTKSYDLRNRAVIKAVFLALLCDYKAGFRIDPKEPEWPVAFIELPTGQVSWHIPQHVNEWDGHDTATKNHRLFRFTSEVEGDDD